MLRFLRRAILGNLRRVLYRIWFGRFGHLGSGVWISLRSEIKHSEKMRIGDGAQIMPYTRIDASLDGAVDIGRDVYICPFTTILAAGGSVTIGDRVHLNGYNFISGQGGLTIGHDTIVAPMASLVANEHSFADTTRAIKDQPEIPSPIWVGSDGWIALGATVLGGVTVGDHVVVGANAVVTKDVPSFTVVVGTPAKVVRSIE